MDNIQWKILFSNFQFSNELKSLIKSNGSRYQKSNGSFEIKTLDYTIFWHKHFHWRSTLAITSQLAPARAECVREMSYEPRAAWQAERITKTTSMHAIFIFLDNLFHINAVFHTYNAEILVNKLTESFNRLFLLEIRRIPFISDSNNFHEHKEVNLIKSIHVATRGCKTLSALCRGFV